MFWTYILKCADRSYYTGHTDNLDVRLAQHQAGTFAGYTHERRPVELVFSTWFPERDQAFAFEMRVKGWSRAKKVALIRGDWSAVSVAAMPPGERAARVERNATSLDCARDERVETGGKMPEMDHNLSPRSSRAQSRDPLTETPA